MSSVTGRSADRLSDTNYRRLADQILAYLKPIVGLLVVWEFAATVGLVPQQALPHTYVVAETLGRLTVDGTLIETTAVTVLRALIAFGLAVVIGVVVGLAMSQFRAVRWFFDPLISFGFPIPKVTLVPVYVLWFGFGTVSAVLLAVTSAVFPVIIATYNGANGVDRELLWSARSMGVSRVDTTFRVTLRAALPEVFNGVQISLFLSFVVVVVAEMVTSGGGLGAKLTQSIRFFQTPTAIAVVIVIAIFGLFFDRLLRAVRRRALHWSDTEPTYD